MRDDAGRRRNKLDLLRPDRYCKSGVTEVSVEDLRRAGIEAVLLDLDNTLVAWQRSEIPDSVLDWLTQLRNAGIKLYLISNTRFGRRLMMLSERLGIPYVRRAWKPRRRGFMEAMERLGVDPEHTAMVGDQMFTDVLGGNRLGLYTVMVKPMARREFIGTKVSRLFERAALAWFTRRGEL
jgi:uncharacterized protein